jgi:CTP synthase
MLDDIVVKKLSIDCKPTDLSEWDSVVNKLYSPEAAFNHRNLHTKTNT